MKDPMQPESGFNFINLYKTQVKALQEQSCADVITPMDQEVPQVRPSLEVGDVIIKSEPSDRGHDLHTLPTVRSNYSNGVGNSSLSSYNIPLTVQAVFSDETNNFLPIRSTTPLSSPSPNPHTSPRHTGVSAHSPARLPSMDSFNMSPSRPQLSPVPNASFLPVAAATSKPRSSSDSSIPRTRTYVTELLGSGCTVVSGPSPVPSPVPAYNFLTNSFAPSAKTLPTNAAPPSMSVPEGSLDFLDLDKHNSMSFYESEDVKPTQQSLKLTAAAYPPADYDESAHLEQAAEFMRSTIHHDCDVLRLPHDPELWTSESVTLWASYMCRKKNLKDISSYLVHVNGSVLCATNPDDFRAQYGESGDFIMKELDLLKAANGLPFSSYSDDSSFQEQFQQPEFLLDDAGLFGHRAASSMFTPYSSMSPAPSPSSSSQDSQMMTSHSFSDHSDEESSYSTSGSSPRPNPPRSEVKPKLGRGHKTTIHLWQFLRELLMSKEHNGDCITWTDRSTGIFKIVDSKKVAKLWGQRKNRPAMNYDKLSRSVRQYYKKGIIKKTEQSKRLVYQFCPDYL